MISIKFMGACNGGVENTSRFSNAQELESPAGQGQIQENEKEYLDTKKGHPSNVLPETTMVFHGVSVSLLGDKEGLGKVAGHSTISEMKSCGLPGIC